MEGMDWMNNNNMVEEVNPLKKQDFYFELPQELIAQDPLTDRAASRLLVLDKETGEYHHRVFSDLPDYLRAGDCLVINDTKVIPARLIGTRLLTEGDGKRDRKSVV